MPGGRPTKYRADYARQARMFAERGAGTNETLAEFFEVSLATIKKWMQVHPEFSAAIKEGRLAPNARVERSLFERATGYEHTETKVMVVDKQIETMNVTKHYPPDTAAAFIWLKNRDPERWRDKQEIIHNGGDNPVKIVLTGKAPDDAND